MRRAAFLPLFATLVCIGSFARPLAAQTYNPKAIHFEGDPQTPIAELLRITGLHEGVPLTKAEIDAGLQKLADTGSFTSIRYTVNDTALTIQLTPAAGGQALPVRFANFLWWKPADLLKILEQRVPLFRGTLPLQGNQTGEVEDALVKLLAEKGIPDAHVTALPSAGGGAVALSITSPQILVGQTHFNGSVSAVNEKLTTLNRELAGQDFDLQQITEALHQSTQEILEDSGYLDVTNDPPVFAAPHPDLGRYVVDDDLTIHPGPLWRINAVTLHAAPPVSQADLNAALPFKSGDPASASDLRVAIGLLARVYTDRAFLEARTLTDVHREPSNHTVSYTFNFVPGAQFHLASIDTSALPSDLQQEFAQVWSSHAGALVDKAFLADLQHTLQKIHTHIGITVGARRDPVTHTVAIVLEPHNQMPTP